MKASAALSSSKLNHRGIVLDILPSLILNIVFIVQAVTLNWRLGTLIWVYWLEGYIILLLGLASGKERPKWSLYTSAMTIYGILLMGMTFPSRHIHYSINGANVSPQEFTKLSNTQWNIVLLNVILLLVGFIIVRFFKKDMTGFGTEDVAKRLTPLNFTILLAVLVPWSIYVFLILRSVFDVIWDYKAAHSR